MLEDEELDKIIAEKEAIIDEEPIIEQTKAEEKAVQLVSETDAKTITDLGLKDIQVKLDHSKSTSEQVKEVVDIAATVKAVQDKDTTEQIAQHKKEELLSDAEAKAKMSAKATVEADSEVQKAKREKYKLLFDTFGVADHIPDWLLKVLMVIFAPFYVLYVIVIGIPCGFVRFLIDCIDGILCRYEKVGDKQKPHIKVTVWVVLSLLIATAACLTALKCTHII